MRYIHEQVNWPEFQWDSASLSDKLAATRHQQGLFAGRIQALGLRDSRQALLDALSDEVHSSSGIEGEHLDRAQVRSSIARRLGIDAGALTPSDRTIEGVVEMTLDATQRYEARLTVERLAGWHSCLFPTGWSGLRRIAVGRFRDDARGPMEVVSGPIGRERVHYVAPAAHRVEGEMASMLGWFNAGGPLDPVLKAALAHLWFVTIHPFDDGNGRIARAIADLSLARADGSGRRYYSMSAQILKQKREYYDILERTQKGSMDITPWMNWFLGCLANAIDGAGQVVGAALAKTHFWDAVPDGSVNERQRLMLNKLLDGFDGKLTTTKWAKIAKCSHDTALRDIQDLITKGILSQGPAGGRSSSYILLGR